MLVLDLRFIRRHWNTAEPLKNSNIKSLSNGVFTLVYSSQRALLMLKQWVKTDGEAATRDEIQYILEGLKMESVLEGVF